MFIQCIMNNAQYVYTVYIHVYTVYIHVYTVYNE